MSEIKIGSLSKSIKGALILNNVSLVLNSGNIYGLRGKNGSGKTMLMRAIAGLLIPDSGTVTINGKVLHKDISFPESNVPPAGDDSPWSPLLSQRNV